MNVAPVTLISEHALTRVVYPYSGFFPARVLVRTQSYRTRTRFTAPIYVHTVIHPLIRYTDWPNHLRRFSAADIPETQRYEEEHPDLRDRFVAV